MGLRKLIRKVTRPVSRVLDKIIPNEIKPALPYLAAAAPILGPQMGILSNLSKLQAAGLYGGGALASQLAQEGSEGDFDLAPILAAAGTGYFAQNPTGGSAIQKMKLNVPGQESMYGSELTFGEKAQNLGIKGLKGIEKFAQQGQNASGAFGTTKAIAKAASPALTTQLGQDAVNFARQAEADYLAELDAFNAEAGATQEANDEARRSHITSSMLAANFTQDVIDTTLDQLGLLLTAKEGGIVSLNMGGSVLPSGGEMDYRQGGMIPMGSKERADDVPARLSKNEFVMTADAVRAAGGGSVNEGAKRMYNLMNNLEARA
jgi:hypothetical protein